MRSMSNAKLNPRAKSAAVAATDAPTRPARAITYETVELPDGSLPLEALGVARIFTPGTPTQDVVDWVNDRARASDASPTR